MEWTNETLKKLALDAADVAYDAVVDAGKKGTAAVTQAKKDLVTEGDLSVNKKVKEFLRESNIPATVFTEEGDGVINIGTYPPRFTIYVDDIDGSLNYRSGHGTLPFCSIVAIYDGTNPQYKDWRVAAIRTMNVDNTILAVKGEGCETWLNEDPKWQPAAPKKTTGLDRRETWIMVDHYMASDSNADPEILKKLQRVYPKTWPGDFRCAGEAYFLLGTGGLDAWITVGQKETELIAGYPILSELRGTIVDFQGNPIGDTKVNFTGTRPILATVTRGLAERILPYL